MWLYVSIDEVFVDVLWLSCMMIYKNVLVGLNVGGGKVVIIGDLKVDKSEVLFCVFGCYVDLLGGCYIIVEDVGIDVNDMENIYLESEYVIGVYQVYGGFGDLVLFIVYGVLQVLMVVMQYKLGYEEVGKVSIVVQGLGYIGMELVKLLCDCGVKLFVIDLDSSWVECVVIEYGVEVVKFDDIYDVNVDVFVFCVLEGVINFQMLFCLCMKIVCGIVNNQFVSLEIGDELYVCGILYVFDYVVNVGGVMNVLLEIDGYNCECVMCLICSIYYNFGCIFVLFECEGIVFQCVVDQIVELCIQLIGKLKMFFGCSML